MNKNNILKQNYLINEINLKGVYSGFVGRKLYNSINYLKDKEIYRCDNTIINYESIDRKHGGIIVFPNNTNDKQLVSLIEQCIITNTNKDNQTFYSIGHYLNCKYTSKNGKIFDDKSITIEILGKSNINLLQIAIDISKIFRQETILLKYFNS